MSSGDEDNLIRLAEAITDEVAVDWAAERREHPELAARLPALRLIERIATVYHSPSGDDPEPVDAGTSWGHLLIRERLGEGGYGTVYRAHDRRLQRDVALKLLRADLPTDGRHAARILAEARLMARVRHPNVLAIHGADEHDGRVGFWTDLLDGETLEDRLASGERLGVAEATAYGRELCRALGAVHGAGLVHGDVKAANVMRDREGRIVLMDFGAGSQLAARLAGAGPLRGTPLSLAPELFAGAPSSAASDIYALGVLLFRLVSGQYPVQAESLAELRRAHADGRRTRLLDLRPDLPADFTQVVEQAIDPDPSRRFASAGAMEAALAPAVRSVGGARSPWRPVRVLSVIAVLAILGMLGAVAVRTGRRGAAPAGPQLATPMTASISLLRVGAGVDEPLAEGGLVHPGDALALNLALDSPAHVYVLNEDCGGGVYVLFPLADTDLHNPLPAGRALRLPGSSGGAELSWRVTEGQGEERFLVVAAREPLTWLDEECARFAAPSRERSVRYSPASPAGSPPDRGVGTVAETPAREGAPASVLDALAARLADSPAAPSGIWFRRLMLYNLGR